MKRPILAAALALGAVTAVPAHAAAGPNDCRKWWDHSLGADYTTAHAACESVQDANNMFRVTADIFRKFDGIHQTARGQWKSCDGARSEASWITDLYVFVSYTYEVRDADTVADGC